MAVNYPWAAPGLIPSREVCKNPLRGKGLYAIFVP